jgi:hypothetical protein
MRNNTVNSFSPIRVNYGFVDNQYYDLFWFQDLLLKDSVFIGNNVGTEGGIMSVFVNSDDFSVL